MFLKMFLSIPKAFSESKNPSSSSLDQYLSFDEGQNLLSVLSDPKQRESLIAHLKSVLSNSVLPQDNVFFSFIKSCFNIDALIFVVQACFRITFTLGVAWILWKISYYIIQKFVTRLSHLKHFQESRHVIVAKSILPIIKSTLQWIFGIILVLIILSELHIDIIPVLLSFSVIGLAVSIGSQTLVKDLINGFLSLLEGNMAVTDVVGIGDKKGTIESLSLRCVYLRHPTGELETIPFSEVGCIINYTRDYAMPKISIVLNHKAPFLEIKKVFEEVFESLKNTYSSYIQGPFQFIGAQKLMDIGIEFVGIVKIIPDPKLIFETEFKNRLIQKVQEHPEWLPLRKLDV